MCVGPEGREFVAGVVRGHSRLAGLPAGGANFSVNIRLLEGLDQADGLVDVSADRQIVHANVTENAVWVDDVGGSKSDSLILGVVKQASVVASNALGDVRQHWDLHGAETSLLTRLHRVLSVGEMGVDRATKNGDVHSGELLMLVTELANLSGADKCEVEGPEEEDNVLACNEAHTHAISKLSQNTVFESNYYLPLNYSRLISLKPPSNQD